MGFAPTWLRQVSPLPHVTTLTTDGTVYSSPVATISIILAVRLWTAGRHLSTPGAIKWQHV